MYLKKLFFICGVVAVAICVYFCFCAAHLALLFCTINGPYCSLRPECPLLQLSVYRRGEQKRAGGGKMKAT